MANEIVPQQTEGGEVLDVSSVDIGSISGDERAAILLLSLNEEETDSIVMDMLKEGEIFQIRPGYVKVI